MTKPGERNRYLRDEAGGIAILGLFLGVTCLMLGGLAVDVSNAIAVRTQLQVAADTAAHAALYTRVEYGASVAQARQKAMDIVTEAFPAVLQGDLLRPEDILFGHYDTATFGFQVDNTSAEAVMVTTDRSRARGNPISTFLLKLVGVPTWDIKRASIFVAYDDPCLQQGWVAEDVVDAQSNNDFYDGFCVHSNQHVEVNQNNYWESGVIVSMPNKADIVVPANSFSKNSGLPEALRSQYKNLRILRHLQTIFDGIADKKSLYYRSYLTNANMVDVPPSNTMVPSDFTTAPALGAARRRDGHQLRERLFRGPRLVRVLQRSCRCIAGPVSLGRLSRHQRAPAAGCRHRRRRVQPGATDGQEQEPDGGHVRGLRRVPCFERTNSPRHTLRVRLPSGQFHYLRAGAGRTVFAQGFSDGRQPAF